MTNPAEGHFRQPELSDTFSSDYDPTDVGPSAVPPTTGDGQAGAKKISMPPELAYRPVFSELIPPICNRKKL